MIKIALLIGLYLIFGIWSTYISYKIGFLESACEPTGWGDEPTPTMMIIAIILFWLPILMVSIIIAISHKIDEYFYKKWEK